MSASPDPDPKGVVIVTGAAGDIGKAICEALLGRGQRVFAVDAGTDRQGSRK